MQTIVLGRAGFVKGVPRLRLTARTIKRGALRGRDNWAMNTTSVIYSTTTELSEAIRGRELSAREVLDAHIAQIERHNPAVNAVVIHDIEKARERARAADDALHAMNRGALCTVFLSHSKMRTRRPECETPLVFRHSTTFRHMTVRWPQGLKPQARS